MQREIDGGGRQAGLASVLIELGGSFAHLRCSRERGEAGFLAVLGSEDGEGAVADQLQYIAAMPVHGRDDDFGIVIEQRNDLLRRGIVGNMRVAVQIAVPQHRADLLGDPAHDPAAHHPPAGIAAEISFGERPGHSGECGGFDRQLEKRREPFQRDDRVLAEAISRIAGPGRIDAIHLADDALGGKAVDEH